MYNTWGSFRFYWLAHPCKTDQCSNTDLDSLNLETFTHLVNKIQFAPTSDNEIRKLLFENRLLWEHACRSAEEYRMNYSIQKFNEIL